MQIYLDLLKDILENGSLKENRTGTDTLSVFGREMRFDLNKGFPLVTTRKVFIKGVLIELFWFLGNHMKDEKYKDLPMTNIKYLLDNNVHIWDGWADEHGDLNKIYGWQWTKWEAHRQVLDSDFRWDHYIIEQINQIDILIKTLKENPDSRRMLVNAWNPGQIEEMGLPPCHYSFQVYSELMKPIERYDRFLEETKLYNLEWTGMSAENAMKHHNFPTRKLSLLWNQRSCDFIPGGTFNIASYAFLTHMLAQVTNHCVGDLIGNFGDTHVYVNQLEGAHGQLSREPRKLPTLKMNRNVKSIYDFKYEDFEILNYNPHPVIKIPISI